MSAVVKLLFGVPQGSYSAHCCFCCTPLSCSTSSRVPDSSYTDDTHLYISAPVAFASVSMQRFIACVERIDAWMHSKRLRMNADKTQLVWLGTRQQLAKLITTELPLLSVLIKPSSAVLDLGVNIDGQLTMADHVAMLRRSCLFQLCQLRMVTSSLTLESAKTLVHAFVSSRLDYCNSLLYGIADGLLTKLQTVQNAAARVVTGTRKFDHITPVLRQLYWLPVCQRITFKLAMITFKCLYGLAPSYLADVCTPVSSVVGRWQLRSVNSGALVVPRTRTTIGRRDFAVAGLATCSSFPVDLRTSSLSRDTFAKKTQNSFIWL